ncbi:MAG: restriction endonuclease subunit S [Patescibacteria group bacterium]
MSKWQKVKIGDFLFERQGRYKPSDKAVSNLRRIEKIDFSGDFFIGNKSSLTDMILVKKGDFVISGINVAKGAMGIYRGDNNVTATIHYSSYTFDERKIDIGYFGHFLRSIEFIRLLKEKVRGGIKTEIKAKHFLSLEINLPNLDTQREISNKLNRVEDRCQALFKNDNFQQSCLNFLRKQILQDVISGKLTADWRAKNLGIESASKLLEKIKSEKEKLIAEKRIKKEKTLPKIIDDEVPFKLPEKWEWCRLGEITTYGTAEKIEPKNILDDVWVLDLEDIEKESSRFINFEIYKNRKSNSTKSVFKKGDVLYSKLRPYLDKVVVAPKDGVCTTEILPLPMFGGMDSSFFMYAMKRKDFLRYADQKVKGMKMPRLGTEDGKRALFPLPPIAEQKAIVIKIEKLMKQISKLEEKIKQNKQDAEMLMQSFLVEAFK